MSENLGRLKQSQGVPKDQIKSTETFKQNFDLFAFPKT